MTSAKVFTWLAMHHGAFWSTKCVFKNGLGVRSCHGMHRVKDHGESTCKQIANGDEIKQGRHKVFIVFNGIDHFDFHVAQHACTYGGQIRH